MVSSEPDSYLRTCKDIPPKREIRDNGDVSLIIVEAFEVAEDCKAKLKATWESIDKTKEKIEEFNKKQDEEIPQ